MKATLAERLTGKLQKLGMSERKAKALVKALVPVVRAAIKADAKQEQKQTAADYEQQLAEKGVPRTALGRVTAPISIATGVVLRAHLPVVPVEGAKGLDLLRVMDGLSTNATYLVAAVKSDVGILAVRQYSSDAYNVKFYPTMAYWGFTEAHVVAANAESRLQRPYYERVHVSQEGLETILSYLRQAAKPKSRMKGLMDRFLVVMVKPLVKAFNVLYRKAA